MFDKSIKSQLKEYFKCIESDVLLTACLDSGKESKEVERFLNEISALSSRIFIEKSSLERVASFEINKINKKTGITFAGVPMGYEFQAFLSAIVQVSSSDLGVDGLIVSEADQITIPLAFVSFVDPAKDNYLDLIQSLNVLALLNEKVSHTTVNKDAFKQEVQDKAISSTPVTYLNGKVFTNDLDEFESVLTSDDAKKTFECLVIGGGPGGTSAAMYAANKGLETGIVAKKIGGQVLDTHTIINIVGIPKITGARFTQEVTEQMKKNDVTIVDKVEVCKIEQDTNFLVHLKSGQVLSSETLIIASGTTQRALQIPGEAEFLNKGVSYSAYCEDECVSGSQVVVVGGGNAGVEAAIDLAQRSKHVYLIEYSDQLTANPALQEELLTFSNVTVLLNSESIGIKGSQNVTEFVYKNLVTNDMNALIVSEVFILVGTTANTSWLPTNIKLNDNNEIIVDEKGMTNIPGLFAAGDCTNIPFKQIMTSIGSGVTAALGAYTYLKK